VFKPAKAFSHKQDLMTICQLLYSVKVPGHVPKSCSSKLAMD